MSRIALLVVGSTLLATLGAGAESGYSRTHSYSARVGSDGTAADATANNGSISSSYEAQRQKVDSYNGMPTGYR